MKRHRLLFFLPLLLLAAACGKKDAAKEVVPERIIPVSTAQISMERLTVPIQIPGVISASNEARPSFKTGGIINRILVEDGDYVKKGQLLATLNLTEINAMVMQANEGVLKASRDLQRAKNLYADSVATLEQVQNATTGLTIAEQSLQMAKFNQSYSEIRSPISGKVVKKIMNEGEVVGPGSPVFYILSEAKQDWVIKSGLADRDWARLRIGDRAEVHLDAYPDRPMMAKVTQLADVGNPLSGTFDAEFTIVGAVPRLAVGLVASVTVFPKEEAEHAVIPVDALIESSGSKATVFVLKSDNTVEKRAVTVGYLYQNKAVITAGLENATLVITTGAPYLEEGSKVKVIQ
jgi:RND family efflux transporter MFP subunit